MRRGCVIWLETRTEADAAKRREAMWGVVWSDEETDEGPALMGRVNGEGLQEGKQFWADAIKDVRDDPARRLAMARRHLPLPAAFREAAIALRSIIRAKRKAGKPLDSELRELHRLAAIASLGIYDELDATPFAKINALDLSPDLLGWEQLALLSTMDHKWMAEAWVTPQRHVTGRSLYPEACGTKPLPGSFGEQAVRAVHRAEEKSRPQEQPSGRTYTLGLAGESFGDRQCEIRKCRVGEVVRLVREPDNQYDANAIRCESSRGAEIGMISSENASWLAPKMDRGVVVTATIREICSQPGKPHKGVVIDCYLNGGDTLSPVVSSPRVAQRGFWSRLLGN
jgi:hypothetical protein